MTSGSVPPEAAGERGEPLLEFRAMIRLLRAECPWKRAQTHESLLPYLREEADEVAEAIAEGDPDHLREELGDLLLQVYFHAAIAEEAGRFTIDDVVAGLAEKMRRRNPHVLGTPEQVAAARGLDAEGVSAAWERIKAAEREG
ncbi:hypothetical protein K8Z61_16440 [Nocardioides sp. TRM66260-LWL]|uniref:MazG nucleotide pyrophosphohydrolase domain-containing protein n=1 Tax=Nocardioides sp. TRM66260-LWL TaxID=2874478 RepID=UPI001CC812F7|nr:MazG nucleotide pyrophosphohydrolase domain-containing protein [Nocardioides sp. TRM66260-LWL]MBZ5736085.1 hypothetical protein [Nocardioides sp. TRM66260-LWL]